MPFIYKRFRKNCLILPIFFNQDDSKFDIHVVTGVLIPLVVCLDMWFFFKLDVSKNKIIN